MNRILKVILFFVCFSCFKIYAYEITYSDWSLEYPEGVKEEFIYSEDRYLWYKENIVNVLYLKKEDIHDRLVDYDDYKFTEESEPSLEYPTIYEDREVKSKDNVYLYYSTDVVKASLVNFSYKTNVISEIELIDKDTSSIVNYSSNLSKINDKDYNNYISVNDKIEINFGSKKDMNKLLFRIYFSDDMIGKTFTFSVLSEDDFKIYNKKLTVNNNIMEINASDLKFNGSRHFITYTYIDKLYKTYETEIEYSDDYYKELDGYTKDESTKKTYYRYITNDEVYYSEFYHIAIPDKEYCVKNRCIKVSTKKETTIINNPQTIDDIDIYFILIIVSFIIIVGLMIIKLEYKNKKNNITN